MPIHTFKEKRNRSTYTHAHIAHIDLFVPTDKYLIKIMQFLQQKRKTICGNFIWLNFGGKILKLHKITCFMRRLLKRITNVQMDFDSIIKIITMYSNQTYNLNRLQVFQVFLMNYQLALVSRCYSRHLFMFFVQLQNSILLVCPNVVV